MECLCFKGMFAKTGGANSGCNSFIRTGVFEYHRWTLEERVFVVQIKVYLECRRALKYLD